MVAFGTMSSSNHNRTAAKYSAAGFATVLGSPATKFTPSQVQQVSKKFHDTTLARLDRHEKIRDVVRNHAKGQ